MTTLGARTAGSWPRSPSNLHVSTGAEPLGMKMHNNSLQSPEDCFCQQQLCVSRAP
ncbi:unnamed protein product [Gulo gulo]|uniref:Uncharacterized protein n=1 Tax=Gulo gulo TaxID=48420 RepID=A0A9X9QB71_GULGU|nr:unnamed protein product [Gulo gulo]